MKALFDLFPVILFFGTYKLLNRGSQSNACLPEAAAHLPWIEQPILMATAVAIAASFVQIGWLIMRKKKVDTMLWISLVIISVFGGATLYFHDATFIQWKPTILYWIIAAALTASPLLAGRNLIRSAMEEQIKLPNRIWKNFNVIWILFFLVLGLANIVAMHNLSCSNWVTFKMFGVTGLTAVFILLQAIALTKYIETDKEKN